MKNSCYKKTLVLGIIVLFVGMSSIPLAGSLSIGKQTFQESSPFAYSAGGASGISLITIKVDGGEMGLNDWYVSDVGINITNESNDIAEIKYWIDGGTYQTYTEPFYIHDDGEDICLEWCAIDYEGNYSDVDGPFICSIDQTKPDIYLEYEVTNINTKEGRVDLLFTATATDYTSGMDRVEFYLNNVWQDTVYGPGPFYQWEFTYYGGLYITIKATAYDKAGNLDWDDISSPPGNIAVLKSSMFHTDINEESSNNYCLDDVLSSEVVERNNHMFTEKLPSGTPLEGVFDPAYVIVVFNREKMGENGWYIGNVSISMFYEYDRVDEVYYQINDGGWMLYTDPVVISEDGIYVCSWYVVDSEGFTSTPESINIKIDQTSPEINLIRKRIAIDKIKFIADVYDETSGIDWVIFASDCAGYFIDYDLPYEWIWTPDDWYDWFFRTWVKVTVYDKAGNYAGKIVHFFPIIQNKKPFIYPECQVSMFFKKIPSIRVVNQINDVIII